METKAGKASNTVGQVTGKGVATSTSNAKDAKGQVKTEAKTNVKPLIPEAAPKLSPEDEKKVEAVVADVKATTASRKTAFKVVADKVVNQEFYDILAPLAKIPGLLCDEMNPVNQGMTFKQKIEGASKPLILFTYHPVTANGPYKDEKGAVIESAISGNLCIHITSFKNVDNVITNPGNIKMKDGTIYKLDAGVQHGTKFWRSVRFDHVAELLAAGTKVIGYKAPSQKKEEKPVVVATDAVVTPPVAEVPAKAKKAEVTV